MLLQFRVKNFKSFKNEAVLDLRADRIKELDYHIAEVGGEKVLPISAIYGANASGKSNLYEALKFMKTFVMSSLNSEITDEQKSIADKFLFDIRSKNEPSEFEAYFILPEDERQKTYNYGFVLDGDRVVEEWLNYKSKTAKEFKQVFYRSDEGLDLLGFKNKTLIKSLESTLEDNVLIISLGSRLKVDICKQVQKWFSSIICLDFASDFLISKSKYTAALNLIMDEVENRGIEPLFKNILDYLTTFDSTIKGVEAEFNSNNKLSRFYTLRDVEGQKEPQKIYMENESAGTRKMFGMYIDLLVILRIGGVLLVDELDARLHPLLVRNLINTFTNLDTNKKNSQLIFTIHDVSLLNEKIYRRDEIWLTEKNDLGESRLYSFSDIVDNEGKKIRNDEDFLKRYMRGNYGGIPSLKSLFKEVNNV